MLDTATSTFRADSSRWRSTHLAGLGVKRNQRPRPGENGSARTVVQAIEAPGSTKV